MTKHVGQIVRLKEADGTAVERVKAVLGAHALSQYERPHDGLAASLHSGPHVDAARQRLEAVLSDLISDAAGDEAVRADVDAGELAQFCLHAVSAPGGMRTEAAVRRLVGVTLTALRAP